METRKITIVATREQKKYVIDSAATTLGELKADLDNVGINYEDMTFMEGLTRTEILRDDSLLPHDVFDVERGKEIAAYRCEIAQRKRDLRNTEDVITTLRGIIENNEYQIYHRFLNRSEVSKHWDIFLKQACDERQSQLENIAFCKKELEKLTK